MQHSCGLSDDNELGRLFQAIQDVGGKTNLRLDELTKTVNGFKGHVAKQLQRHDADIVGI